MPVLIESVYNRYLEANTPILGHRNGVCTYGITLRKNLSRLHPANTPRDVENKVIP